MLTRNLYIPFLFIQLITISLATKAQKKENNISADKREILIQRAASLRKEERYQEAVIQLDTILAVHPNEASILLFKGDLLLQAKQFATAASVYKQLLPLGFEKTITQINLSYALFMNHQPANALRFAKSAWEQDSKNASAIVNYFNAMLWNVLTKEAEQFLHEQGSLLKPAQKIVLKARLYTTAGNFQEGLKYYDSLVKSYPDKYYFQEYAEVLLGKQQVEKSTAVMSEAKPLFSENEYKAFAQKVQAVKQQYAGTEMVYFTDVAKNTRIENSLWWQQGGGRKLRLRLSASHATYTSISKEKTTSSAFQAHIEEKLSKTISGETDMRLQTVQMAGGETFMGIMGQQTIRYQPNDRKMFGVSFSSDILNFTAALLGKNIRSNNIGYVTHLMIDGKTGFYSQGSMGMLTDNNQRYQFFGSFYRLLRTEPTLKMGVNFSALHFSDSSNKNYFSPNRYLNTEVFADFSTPLPMMSKFYLQAQAAAGMQQIEKLAWEPSVRLQTEVGIRLKHLEAGIRYQTSNVASNTGTGYKFNWFTGRLIWKW